MTLGDIYFQRNFPDLAIKAYNEIEAGSQEAAASHKNRLHIYIQSKRWNEAVDFLTSEYEHTNDEQTLVLLAGFEAFLDPKISLNSIHRVKGIPVSELEQIIQELSNDGQDDSTKSALFLKMGHYFELNKMEPIAEAAYRHACELDPGSAIALASLGKYLSLLDSGGETEIARSLELDPNNSTVNQIVGMFWISQNKPEIALIYLKKASQLNPHTPENWILLGDTYNKLGDYKNGLRHWVKAAAISQSPELIWRQIAEFCVQNQAFINEYGLDAIQKLLLQNPASAENLDFAGRVYLTLNDLYIGEKYLQTAIQQFPEYYPAQLHLGIWLVSSGNLTEGRRWINAAADQKIDDATRKQALDYLAED